MSDRKFWFTFFLGFILGALNVAFIVIVEYGDIIRAGLQTR